MLSVISLKGEVDRVKKQKAQVLERLRPLGNTYNDLLIPDEEYNRQKKLLEMELEKLVVPWASAEEEASNPVQRLPDLWPDSNL